MKKTPSTTNQNVETLDITDFSGRLSRIKNGTLNSGLSKFSTSFGYDPFSKPGQLTWFETPVDLDSSGATVTDLIVATKNRTEAGIQYVYAIGSTGRLYKIQPNSVANANLDSITLLTTLSVSSPTFNFGASLEFWGSTEKIYVGCDAQVNSVNFDGTGEALIGSKAGSNYAANTYRPLRSFQNLLCFGNGTNIGTITAGGAIDSYAKLSPGFPPEVYVQDLDVSMDYNYLLITASNLNPENIATVASDRQASASANGFVFRWNGSDTGTTAGTQIPSFAITGLQTFLQNQYFFSNDTYGGSLNDFNQKIITLPNNKSPFANSIISNGNFISWVVPEFANSTLSASMYYFGNLDKDLGKGLWRLFRLPSTQSNGFMYQTPLNTITNNLYSSVNNAITSVVTFGYGKHYFSTMDISNGGGTTKNKLFRFLVTSSGSGTPQLGVYETQNQLFSKRISISEVRVYAEPTVTGNGFQLDVIGSDGNVVTNGTYTYSYAAGTDITLLQGALERINFNVNVINLYSFAIRITNTGTTNMTINKIEVDWEYSGK